jgi:hypothetical protein
MGFMDGTQLLETIQAEVIAQSLPKPMSADRWLLSSAMQKAKYGISQSDMYQLFAYGKRCLPDQGALFLIYPKTKRFNAPLAHFSFTTQKLWIVPFDMEEDVLCLGNWHDADAWLKSVKMEAHPRT